MGALQRRGAGLVMTEASGIVVLGIGNLLCCDDGVGVHAVRALERASPVAGVAFVDVGTALLVTDAWLRGARHVLVLDAVRHDGRAGAIHAWTVSVDSPDNRGAWGGLTAHAMDLLAVLRNIPPDARPRDVRILGVEPYSLGYGLELSAPVAAALPALVARAREILRMWCACDAA